MKVLAFSVDDREHARKMRDKHEIAFRLGYGVDAVAFARATGCFFDADDLYLHASGYILRPDGSIASAVYSTGGIGRLRAEEALEQVKFFRGD